MARSARACWLRSPGHAEIRPAELPPVGPADVLVRTLWSAVSRGTERVVAAGRVPPRQYAIMRAPFQEGDFPGPVKYGYLNVGVVEAGPGELVGRTVFCLFPHQTRYVVPAAAVVVVPDDVPASRAVLAGTMETAVNALWDAAPLVGDRIAVVGAGMVGCCCAALAARLPGVDVQLVDTDPDRAAVAERLGTRFALPADAEGDLDLVVHTAPPPTGWPRAWNSRRPRRPSWNSAGTGTGRSPSRSARRSTRVAWSYAAARSARSPRPAAAGARSPTGWAWPFGSSPTRPWTCSSPTNGRSTSCPSYWAGWPATRYRGSATGSATTRRTDCSA